MDTILDKNVGNFWRWGRGQYASCGHAGGLSCLTSMFVVALFIKRVSTKNQRDNRKVN